jgi:hypothetical protein
MEGLSGRTALVTGTSCGLSTAFACGPPTSYCSNHADFSTGQTMLVDGGPRFE